MAKSLRIQNKQQIEEIVILLHNVAFKVSDEIKTSKYETRRINTIIQIGSCIKKDSESMDIVFMDVADGSVYTGNPNCKHFLNNKTDILYIYEDITEKIDQIASEIIKENNRMYENGETIKKILKDILD